MHASSGYIGFIPNLFVRTILISSSSASSASTKSSWNIAGAYFFTEILVLYLRSCLSITSSTRSIDTYISLLTCSERITCPFAGIVTSIFCLSFSTLSVTYTSVSGLKNFSSFDSFSSTACLSPSVNSMFFPEIVILMMSNPFIVYLIRCLYHVNIIP